MYKFGREFFLLMYVKVVKTMINVYFDNNSPSRSREACGCLGSFTGKLEKRFV